MLLVGFAQEMFCLTLAKFCCHSNGHAELGVVGLGAVTIETSYSRK